MRAMILAAGRGERMRPLTDTLPKPLLLAGGKPLIVWHLERLAAAGFVEVVINHAHLGACLLAALGDGSAYGLRLHWSAEPPGALETAGGIARALPLLGADGAPFLVVNGDIYCDWDFAAATDRAAAMPPAVDAHLVLVDNPLHHPAGDFVLDAGRLALASADANIPMTRTYAGIGLFRPAFFAGVDPDQPKKLRPLLDAAIPRQAVSGEHHQGCWVDVGTPQRLAELDALLTTPPAPGTLRSGAGPCLPPPLLQGNPS